MGPGLLDATLGVGPRVREDFEALRPPTNRHTEAPYTPTADDKRYVTELMARWRDAFSGDGGESPEPRDCSVPERGV